MKKFHIAISTDNIDATVVDYSARLEAEPCLFIAGQYALWRTACLNVSIRQDGTHVPGTVRHLGWEDPEAPQSTQDKDVNGMVWEHFSADQQADEINQIWPEASYTASNTHSINRGMNDHQNS